MAKVGLLDEAPHRAAPVRVERLAAAQMSEEKAALLRNFPRRIAESRRRIEMLHSGSITVQELTASGWRDLRDETIRGEEGEIAEYERLLALYYPEGMTAEGEA